MPPPEVHESETAVESVARAEKFVTSGGVVGEVTLKNNSCAAWLVVPVTITPVEETPAELTLQSRIEYCVPGFKLFSVNQVLVEARGVIKVPERQLAGAEAPL